MGIIMVCDRCEKPITGNLDDRTSNRLRIHKEVGPKAKALVSADLCDPCVEALKDFIFDHGTEREDGGQRSKEQKAGTPRPG